jgi:hypothetical protein
MPINVGIVGDEDDIDSVWTSRLHAAGAALERVCQIDRPDGGLVNVGEDRERLARLVRDAEIGFLYFDQLLDNLGAGTDDWRQNQVREALAPLRVLARELDIAALGTLHPNKRGNTFRELVAGSSAFNAVSRSSLLLAQHPDDPRKRCLVRGKGNLSERPTPLEFELTSHSFTANGHEFSVPLVVDVRASEYDVEDLIGTTAETAEYSKTADAVEIIEALLPRDGDWHPPKPVYEACLGEGISERVVQRAKNRLGIEHRRTETFPAAALWRWRPEPGTPSPGSPDTVATRDMTVASVATVATVADNRSSSNDTRDAHDTEDTRRDRGGTEEMAADDPGPYLVDPAQQRAALAERLRRELEAER